MAETADWIEQFQQAKRIDALDAIAARFVYALRLIALYERARRDPVAELAVRMGSVTAAAEAMTLAKALGDAWPENIHVSRFCCKALTHDEVTIGRALTASRLRDRDDFAQELRGLIRPDRIERLWERCTALVVAESLPAT